MKKIMVWVCTVFTIAIMTCLANAATLGYVDVQKVFSSYEKTKKMQDYMRKKEQSIKEEIENKQQLVEKEKNKGMSTKDLRNLVEKYEKEMEPKKTEIVESQKRMAQEIRDDVVKATESTAKKLGIEIVLDKNAFITGGTDITDEVIKLLNKK